MGMTSLLFGTIICGWVLYNIFVKTSSVYTGPQTPLSLIFGGFGLAGILFKYGWHSLMILLGIRVNKDFEI
jgi:hypothetical protein